MGKWNTLRTRVTYSMAVMTVMAAMITMTMTMIGMMEIVYMSDDEDGDCPEDH